MKCGALSRERYLAGWLVFKDLGKSLPAWHRAFGGDRCRRNKGSLWRRRRPRPQRSTAESASNDATR
jgi:hypothetical protein